MERDYECYGVPMVNVYDTIDKVETDDYILTKKSYRYPYQSQEMLEGGLIPSDYIVLYSKKRCCVVMSDTPMERYTNQSIMYNATGNICMLELGIGMTIFGMLEEQAKRCFDYEDGTDEENRLPLKSITIIEKDAKLIELIEPLIRNNFIFQHSGIKLEIINADAYEYPKTYNRHFDIVYADIWDEYHGYSDEAEVFDELEELYSPLCDSFDGWGYSDSHGDNPEDESPIAREDYSKWLAGMILEYKIYEAIDDDIYQNIIEYAEFIA